MAKEEAIEINGTVEQVLPNTAHHVPVQVNRALARTGLVKDGGPPRCPQCAQRLAFGTDRLGRTTESCGCGYRAYVQVRATEPGILAPPALADPPV